MNQSVRVSTWTCMCTHTHTGLMTSPLKSFYITASLTYITSRRLMIPSESRMDQGALCQNLPVLSMSSRPTLTYKAVLEPPGCTPVLTPSVTSCSHCSASDLKAVAQKQDLVWLSPLSGTYPDVHMAPACKAFTNPLTSDFNQTGPPSCSAFLPGTH